MYMWQSWVEIKHYSVAYFDRVTYHVQNAVVLKLLLRVGLIRNYVDLAGIHAPTLCIRAPPLTKVPCDSVSNTVMQLKHE